MKRILFVFVLVGLWNAWTEAQTIAVSPREATVNAQGATGVLLTFRGVGDRRPVEGTFCGAIVPATSGVGFECDPATVFGRLPVRYDQSRRTGGGDYSDVLSVPPSVARRAYLDAPTGGTFFYVRRFTATKGNAPDEFVPVMLRLSGNGAAAPFSLINVRLLWDDGKKTIPFIKSNEALPTITAEILYTGTGRLTGRWELVKPGDDPPTERDLLPEAALPVEERGRQRRFMQLSRFNVLLPPNGKIVLPGPENWRIEKGVAGQYQLLFRIEAVTDSLRTDPVSGGGVAGFSLPTLRYFVAVDEPSTSRPQSSGPPVLAWEAVARANLYRVVVTDPAGNVVLTAVVKSDRLTYRVPSWLAERAGGTALNWRVVALDKAGRKIDEGPIKELAYPRP